MKFSLRGRERRKKSRSLFSFPTIKLHPLFWIVGICYSFTGELLLFLMSCFVALEHECAHAYGASKLGYKLNRIVLMPYGAVIDGDLKGISFKDEALVAFYGPACNLLTAGFFVALWWLFPDTYAFTDTACYSSFAIAVVNLLPAYPLDGGRIFKSFLLHAFLKRNPQVSAGEKRVDKICRLLTLGFSLCFFAVFIQTLLHGKWNFSALAFGVFLLFGAFGNAQKPAVYEKLDFSAKNAFLRGVEIRRIALSGSKPVKDVFKYISPGSYLVLEVYDDHEEKLFEISQNELSNAFLFIASPYTPLRELKK